MTPTLHTMRQQHWAFFEGISGSKAYGLDRPGSDMDIKGIFVLPQDRFYGLDTVTQLTDEKNDTVFYELGRVVELLLKNNPNLLELLALSPQHILYQDPLFELFRAELFLSKLCKDTFAGYAVSQIKKARGLNKKVLNPMGKERKSLLHFCWVTVENQTVPLLQWLQDNKLQQEQCGLVNMDHMKGMYGVFVDRSGDLNFQGVLRKMNSSVPATSSIPKGYPLSAYVYVNQDGFATYCKDYKAYWDWVDKRNDLRYENTISHGKNYDAKNMMHTFRLLNMAEEILETGKILVYRNDREELLRIRDGEFEYDELLKKAEKKLARIEEVATRSQLPAKPDRLKAEQLLVQIREEMYARASS